MPCSVFFSATRPVRLVGVNTGDSFTQKFVTTLDSLAIVFPEQRQKFVIGLLTVAASNVEPLAAGNFPETSNTRRTLTAMPRYDVVVRAYPDRFENTVGPD